MKNEKLFRAFSLIDDDLVAEAAPETETASETKAAPQTKAAFFKRRSAILIAACLLLVVIIPMSLLLIFPGFGVGVFTTPDAVTTSGPIQSDQGGTNNTETTRRPVQANPVITNDSSLDDEEPSEGDEAVDQGEWGTLIPDSSAAEGFPSGEGNSYTEIIENTFVNTTENNTSYFSIDASTASFPEIRSTIKRGYLPYKNAVRVEEMLNYFKYDYVSPTDGSILALNASMFDAPYNSEVKLLTVGLAAEEVVFSEIRNNLVFLIDVSGSMSSSDKLPLVQQAFTLLAENLNPEDRISIVTYAGNDSVALAGAYGYEKAKITAVISDLTAGGVTAGSAGITTAYELAQEYYIEGGNNRVILMTDGDFNVGVTDTGSLEGFIAEKRDTGVYFSVYGFGYGNLKNDKMEALALNGNGVYSYIDSVKEARRALVEEIGGSIVTVAKDVKAGLVFNPEYVESYRLVGYENKQLTQEEFENSKTDAGELGSGHTVTVVYEVKLTEKALSDVAELGSVTLKYKTPDTDENREESLSLSTTIYHKELTEQDVFIASVVEFALLLRNSEYKANANAERLLAQLEALELTDEYKVEFRDVVKQYVAIVNGSGNNG